MTDSPRALVEKALRDSLPGTFEYYEEGIAKATDAVVAALNAQPVALVVTPERLFALECAHEMAVNDRDCSLSGKAAAQRVVDDIAAMIAEARSIVCPGPSFGDPHDVP